MPFVQSSTKIIVFEVTGGSFEAGFLVNVSISVSGQSVHETIFSRLPPAPDIPKLYRQWRSTYLSGHNTRITLTSCQVTNCSSIKERQSHSEALVQAMQAWLENGREARRLECALWNELDRRKPAQFILKTQDDYLQKLPWHRWSLFENFPNLTLALHMPYPAKSPPIHWPVRTLAVLGDNENLEHAHRDLELIHHLPRTQVKVLRQPSIREFSQTIRDRRGWDILFFAGHSTSEIAQCQDRHSDFKPQAMDGVLYLNEQESLSLKDVYDALQDARKRGLRLLMLNSCDGLGLARSIASVRIPHTIVMREPVPDCVAHEFLQHFLDALSHGDSLSRALQVARSYLHDLKQEFPSASWLPILCQHPSAQTFHWPGFLAAPRKVKVAAAIAIFGVTGLILGPKYFSPDRALRANLSSGEDVLVQRSAPTVLEHESHELHQAGVQAYANRDFETAIAKFDQALAKVQNSPETLIYRNNAVNQLDKAETVTIGVTLPITVDLNASLEIMRGVAQAQQEFNQSDRKGNKRIQILLADDENDPKVADDIAESFGRNRNLVAVIGSYTSDISLETLEEYRDSKLPVISATSTSVDLSDASDYFFRTVPNDAAAAVALATYACEQWENRHVVIYHNENSKYSQSLRKAFASAFEALEGKVVEEFDFQESSFNAYRSLNIARDKNADVVFLAPNHDVLDKAIQVISVNETGFPVLGGDDVYSSKTLTVGGKNALATVVSVPWHPDNSPDPQFPRSAFQIWNARVSWRTALAYDAMLAIAKAMETEPSRTGIHQALRNPQFKVDGASGLVQFDGRGDRITPTQLVQVVQDEPSNKIQFAPIPANQNNRIIR